MLFSMQLFFYLIFTNEVKTKSVFMKLPEIKINETEIKMKIHLNNEHIKIICKNSGVICKSNDTNICGIRVINDEVDYMEFENSCFMFLANMCVYPDEEFYIVSSGSCEQYKARRQLNIRRSSNKTDTEENKNDIAENKTVINEFHFNGSTGKPPLRSEDTFSPLYDLETAYDYHVCPHSCPDIYKPECVSANRGMGKYFKFFTFINHCVGDMYYCKHYDEFAPPEDESEDVKSSPLGWSYCGSSKYVQFAGFAETASSMGHYGWLAGNNRYSQIMEPHQKFPGYGKK